MKQFSTSEPLQKFTPMRQLKTIPTWKKSDTQRDQIEKQYAFDNFLQSFQFMSKVARVAEDMCHHPEWFNVYNRVEVVLSTHDVGGLSRNDIALAKEMDQISENVKNMKLESVNDISI
eukprot:UN01614